MASGKDIALVVLCNILCLVIGAACGRELERESSASKASFAGPAHDDRERAITVHEIAPGACVALYRESDDPTPVVAMAAIPCPPPEAPR